MINLTAIEQLFRELSEQSTTGIHPPLGSSGDEGAAAMDPAQVLTTFAAP
ncbi:MAG: hypothetical protein HQK56_16735, partial [Deltaproteobacteria bacterium]|nr:hypothetical protein [Deltaproteobacteria bacterium]